MTRLITLLLTMITLSSAQADMLHYAQRFTHHSALLGETRQYSVSLPQEYEREPGARFPVLYLLDGEKSLLEVVGITRALRAGLNPAIPPPHHRRGPQHRPDAGLHPEPHHDLAQWVTGGARLCRDGGRAPIPALSE
ncbi:hypothetical protein [Aeromonas caviae]|uniref:hypothetical protein n=1 Tax=Aeromonas caviae TaxID=648 RepID=UPI00244AE329|nr:hypothetical protein [Aeromonas caviae]MDH1637109.1 hypothetical protein [Aeromonas caviae]MDT8956521.1 hypothetical protein [Aeromonas caviae]